MTLNPRRPPGEGHSVSGEVEIISVGNELLIGKVVNTNAQWLARRCTTLGMKVRRITVVGDSLEEISSAVKEALSRRPRFIITTGGLGPTFDDKTLEGIALCLGRELKVDGDALNMVKDAYRRLVEEGRIEGYELTPHRVKMARLPEGAKPLANPVGVAPGVAMNVDGTTIIALPGVPAEMKAIFEESVAQMIRDAAGDATFFEASLLAYGVVESDLAPIVEEAMKANPYVYIKSHPRWAGRTPYIELHLSTTAEDSNTARKRLSSVIVMLTEMIKQAGGSVKPQ